MKKLYSILLMISLLIYTNTANAQTPYLSDIIVNGTPISNCSIIDFGNNSSVNLSLKMRVTKAQTYSVGDFATFKLYIQKNSTSVPKFISGI